MCTDRRPIRSLLFAPAVDERKLSRLPRCGADAIVLDLEDAVATAMKTLARARAASAIGTLDHDGLTAVRLNGLETGLTRMDLDAVLQPGLDAVILPKVESAAEVTELATMLDGAEDERGLPRGGVAILALVETAGGILASGAIAAASPRLATLVLGSGDLAAELGMRSSGDGAELLLARSMVVFAAGAARLAPPLDGPYFSFRDESGLAADCARSRGLGFGGRVAVHPDQVAMIGGAYGAAPPDRGHLGRVVAAFETAERRGVAAIEVDGEFVDYPVYRRAQRELGRVPLAGSRVGE